EELLQVQVDHPAVAGCDVLLSSIQCLMGTPSRAKAEAGIRERRIELRCKHLQQGLLNQSVENGRNAEHPHTLAPRLGDFHLPHGAGNVRAAQQFFPDGFPALANERGQVVDGDAVYAGCSPIAHDTMVRLQHVLAAKHLLHGHRNWWSGGSIACRARLTRRRLTLGGSAAYSGPLLGHLSLRSASAIGHRMVCAGRFELFGPSPASRSGDSPTMHSSYYGLG